MAWAICERCDRVGNNMYKADHYSKKAQHSTTCYAFYCKAGYGCRKHHPKSRY